MGSLVVSGSGEAFFVYLLGSGEVFSCSSLLWMWVRGGELVSL